MTRQHDQVYSNKYGPPIGRPGNGLGDVWSETDALTGASRGRRQRMTTPVEPVVVEQESGEDEDLVDVVHESIGRLTARQAFVIRLRYGFGDNAPCTLREAADLMGITHQAVSDIEQRALKTLQKLVEDAGVRPE